MPLWRLKKTMEGDPVGPHMVKTDKVEGGRPVYETLKPGNEITCSKEALSGSLNKFERVDLGESPAHSTDFNRVPIRVGDNEWDVVDAVNQTRLNSNPLTMVEAYKLAKLPLPDGAVDDGDDGGTPKSNPDKDDFVISHKGGSYFDILNTRTGDVRVSKINGKSAAQEILDQLNAGTYVDPEVEE